MISPSHFATSFLFFSAIPLATFVTSSRVAAPNHVYFFKNLKTIPHYQCTATHSNFTKIAIPISFHGSRPPVYLQGCGSLCRSKVNNSCPSADPNDPNVCSACKLEHGDTTEVYICEQP